MEIFIRKAVERDFEDIFRLIKEHALYSNQHEKVSNSIEQMIEEKDFFDSYVAENEEGEIVASAIYSYIYFTWHGKCIYLDDLFVTEGYRGKGIGALIMNELIDEAKKTNSKLIGVMTSSTNVDAKNFYSKFGADISTSYDNLFIDIAKQ